MAPIGPPTLDRIECQPGQVQCFCEGKPPGVYAVSWDVKRYYDCATKTLRECLGDMGFDAKRGLCAP